MLIRSSQLGINGEFTAKPDMVVFQTFLDRGIKWARVTVGEEVFEYWLEPHDGYEVMRKKVEAGHS